MTASEPLDVLLERLRTKIKVMPSSGGGMIGTGADGKLVSSFYVTDDGRRLVNPDGPPAAHAITALTEQLAEMTRVASELADMADSMGDTTNCSMADEAIAAVRATIASGVKP